MDLNTATFDNLKTIHGIGPVKANAIVRLQGSPPLTLTRLIAATGSTRKFFDDLVRDGKILPVQEQVIESTSDGDSTAMGGASPDQTQGPANAMASGVVSSGSTTPSPMNNLFQTPRPDKSTSPQQSASAKRAAQLEEDLRRQRAEMDALREQAVQARLAQQRAELKADEKEKEIEHVKRDKEKEIEHVRRDKDKEVEQVRRDKDKEVEQVRRDNEYQTKIREAEFRAQLAEVASSRSSRSSRSRRSTPSIAIASPTEKGLSVDAEPSRSVTRLTSRIEAWRRTSSSDQAAISRPTQVVNVDVHAPPPITSDQPPVNMVKTTGLATGVTGPSQVLPPANNQKRASDVQHHAQDRHSIALVPKESGSSGRS